MNIKLAWMRSRREGEVTGAAAGGGAAAVAGQRVGAEAGQGARATGVGGRGEAVVGREIGTNTYLLKSNYTYKYIYIECLLLW